MLQSVAVPSGTGKSHLLIGLGIAACEQGRRVRYVTCASLVNERRVEPSLQRMGPDFSDPRLAAAVVDRLTFRAHIIGTGTDSYRLRLSRASKKKP